MMRLTSLEEVEEIVKNMAQGKDLGSEGFTTDCFQARRPIFGTNIWEVVEESTTLDPYCRCSIQPSSH